MHKQRVLSIIKFYSMTFRDYLLHASPLETTATTQPPPPQQPQPSKIGKNVTTNDTPKTEKKEKKLKKPAQMSDSRVKKFHKLFAQKIPPDERLINYFSCALVADILLQGHLYVSERFFSFYSNVFGYVTKLVIPIASVTFVSKEKTAKMFPNAIGIQLEDAKHVFGSFISRETAYQLMVGMIKKMSYVEDKVDCVDGAKDDEEEDEEVEVGVLGLNPIPMVEILIFLNFFCCFFRSKKFSHRRTTAVRCQVKTSWFRNSSSMNSHHSNHNHHNRHQRLKLFQLQ
jgi:hypothetical protein